MTAALLGLAGSPAFAQHAEFQLGYVYNSWTSDLFPADRNTDCRLPSNSRQVISAPGTRPLLLEIMKPKRSTRLPLPIHGQSNVRYVRFVRAQFPRWSKPDHIDFRPVEHSHGQRRLGKPGGSGSIHTSMNRVFITAAAGGAAFSPRSPPRRIVRMGCRSWIPHDHPYDVGLAGESSFNPVIR